MVQEREQEREKEGYRNDSSASMAAEKDRRGKMSDLRQAERYLCGLLRRVRHQNEIAKTAKRGLQSLARRASGQAAVPVIGASILGS